jgi:hypothetical protein
MSLTKIKTGTGFLNQNSHHLVNGISPGKLRRNLPHVVFKDLLLQKTFHAGLNLLFDLKFWNLCEFQVLLHYCNSPESVKAVRMDALPRLLGIENSGPCKSPKSVKVI